MTIDAAILILLILVIYWPVLMMCAELVSDLLRTVLGGWS